MVRSPVHRNTLISCTTDLRLFVEWCITNEVRLCEVHRAHLEIFGRAMEADGRMRSTDARRPPPARELLVTFPLSGQRIEPLRNNPLRVILNPMVQYQRARFDSSFAALADATRRGVLEQLTRSDASITDLAERFHMTLTGMKKHVAVLERAGLVVTEKVGRVRTCKLGRRALAEEGAWIERYRQLWATRFDELDQIIEELKQKEKAEDRKKR